MLRFTRPFSTPSPSIPIDRSWNSNFFGPASLAEERKLFLSGQDDGLWHYPKLPTAAEVKAVRTKLTRIKRMLKNAPEIVAQVYGRRIRDTVAVLDLFKDGKVRTENLTMTSSSLYGGIDMKVFWTVLSRLWTEAEEQASTKKSPARKSAKALLEHLLVPSGLELYDSPSATLITNTRDFLLGRYGWFVSGRLRNAASDTVFDAADIAREVLRFRKMMGIKGDRFLPVFTGTASGMAILQGTRQFRVPIDRELVGNGACATMEHELLHLIRRLYGEMQQLMILGIGLDLSYLTSEEGFTTLLSQCVEGQAHDLPGQDYVLAIGASLGVFAGTGPKAA